MELYFHSILLCIPVIVPHPYRLQTLQNLMDTSLCFFLLKELLCLQHFLLSRLEIQLQYSHICHLLPSTLWLLVLLETFEFHQRLLSSLFYIIECYTPMRAIEKKYQDYSAHQIRLLSVWALY